MDNPRTASPTSRPDLLDPATLSQLGGIEFIAREVVEGFLMGLHRSPHRGFSAEFAELRAYQAGDDLRYIDNKARAEHGMEVNLIVEEWTMQHSKYEVMKLVGDACIPCGAMLNAEDIHTDPHLLERGMIVTIDHPQRGKFKIIGDPIKLSDSQTHVTAAPLLGQHTEEVLDQILGITGDEVTELREAGVI